MVRSDLTAGEKCAQTIHAAGESAALSPEALSDGAYAVALTGDSAQLCKLVKWLRRDEVPHSAIYEPDPPYNGELVAVGIAPSHKHLVQKYTSRLKLVR